MRATLLLPILVVFLLMTVSGCRPGTPVYVRTSPAVYVPGKTLPPPSIAGFVAPDGSVHFGHGGVMGQTFKFTNYSHLKGGVASLSNPRRKGKKEEWTVTALGPSMTRWKVQRNGGTQSVQFNKLTLSVLRPDGLFWNAGVHPDIDLLTFTYPNQPIKVGDTWLVFNPTKPQEPALKLTSVSDLKGRLVANVEMWFAMPLGKGKHLHPIVCSIDVVTGLVLQAKGESRLPLQDWKHIANYVFDREFDGTQ